VPQVLAAWLLTKKPDWVLMRILFWALQLPAPIMGSAVAVVKENVTATPVLLATRSVKGMVIDTAVTTLDTPTVPVAEQTVE